MTWATCRLLITAPVQCVIERQINRERIVIFGRSRTISVVIDSIAEHVEEECMLIKLLLAKQKNQGENIYVVMWTSKIKEQCRSSCHFGRGFLNDKSLYIVIGGGTLRKLIYSLTGGPHAHTAFLVFHNPWKAAAVIVSSTIPCMRFLRPITGLPQESEEDKWSSLPFLLLWMIKDRLDFFNNAKVALVCRHWWYGSRNNPTKMQTVGDGMPWIMLNASAGGNKCVREFINFERTKKFAIEMPEFYQPRPLFSRRGWILLRRKNVCTKDHIVVSLVLINPLTKGKIELSDVVIDREGSGNRASRGCFSISQQDGIPNCVVVSFLDSRGKGKISLYITYPGGDQVWTKQSYVVKKFYVGNIITVINSQVYICNNGGTMVMYDMGSQTWKEIETLPELEYLFYYMIELEEQIYLYGRMGYSLERNFFKYSHTHNCWQGLEKDGDANNMIIFIEERCNALAIRIPRGFNIYEIIGGREKRNAQIVDYLLFKTCNFTLHGPEAFWVDIG